MRWDDFELQLSTETILGTFKELSLVLLRLWYQLIWFPQIRHISSPTCYHDLYLILAPWAKALVTNISFLRNVSYVPSSQTGRQASLPCFGLRTTLSHDVALAHPSWLDPKEERTTIAKKFYRKVLKEGLQELSPFYWGNHSCLLYLVGSEVSIVLSLWKAGQYYTFYSQRTSQYFPTCETCRNASTTWT